MRAVSRWRLRTTAQNEQDQWLNAISQIESGQQQFGKKDGQGTKRVNWSRAARRAGRQILPRLGERWASQMGSSSILKTA